MTIRTVFESVLDFLYPPACVACGQLLTTEVRHICRPCWSQVVLASDHPDLAHEALEKMGQAVDTVASAFVFQKTGPLQSLIHALKYQNADQVGIWLGEQAAGHIGPMLGDVDLVVPVPLHRAKERERGYNQAAMIARGLGAALRIQSDARLLRRVRHTPTQTKLSIEQRRVNVAEAFSVDERAGLDLSDATVLVVDDVITTGATIAACAAALRRAGVSRVVAGSVALADHDA